MKIHPKTSGAAVGSALGVLLVAIIHSIHGVHFDATVYGALTAFLSVLGAWLAPAPDVTNVTGNETVEPHE